ncbi:caspase family protein [Candidatus Pacearchaeota archaeon]|nr:caspase family protein [Candidatus Pacearchaeota archaeon]
MIKKALCIGNADYPEGSLENPVNDAQDVAERIETLGFECIVLADAKIAMMQESLRLFSDELEEAEVGLFFFAGHGMQIEGDNYLTAVDTDFERELGAKYSSLPLNMVIDVLEQGQNPTSIIILDACRNNPYERRWRDIGSRGLAPVYAPKGTIIAYATSPGQVASDGHGSNGAFTAALLKHLTHQNVSIEDLFKRVRNTLSAVTSGRQISWEHTCLMGDFFFNQAILTEEFIAEYSKEAFSDANYQIRSGRPVDEIISRLKSCDWYKQNPAITTLSGIDWTATEKDELFVLGRNLYQAACGGSRTADSYFSDIQNRLSMLDEEVAFHLFNGMMYEIYFDSYGRFRLNKKTGRIDDVLSLEDLPRFARSFDFICQALMQYEKYLFYMPGSTKDVLVDITNTDEVEGNSIIESISVEGQDVFYANDGETLISNTDEPFLYSQTDKQFETGLASAMVTPTRHLKLTYAHTPSPEWSLVAPYNYRIQKVSL